MSTIARTPPLPTASGATQVPSPRGAAPDEAAEGGEETFKTLSAEEAQALRQRLQVLSPWRVVAGQVVVGMVVSGLALAFTGRMPVLWSSLYGAAAVVIPAALFARGLTSRVASVGSVGRRVGASAFSFLLWEMVKIGLTVAMLMLARRVIADLSWPAMLVGLVVTMKVYWAALVFQNTFARKRPSFNE